MIAPNGERQRLGVLLLLASCSCGSLQAHLSSQPQLGDPETKTICVFSPRTAENVMGMGTFEAQWHAGWAS